MNTTNWDAKKNRTRAWFIILNLLFLMEIATGSIEPMYFENPIFTDGEELVYRVSWMGIRAGTITIRLEDAGLFRNKPAYKSTVIGETSKMFSRFFKVRDTITSIFTKEELLSLLFEKNIREGKYRRYRKTSYDQENLIAKTLKKDYRILPRSKDPIACIFTLRKEPLDIGSVIRMNANADGKNYPIEIRVTRREKVKLHDKTRTALVCEPLPTWEGRVFEKNKSKAILWVSDDKFHVPLKIMMKVKIGSLKAILIARDGPGWKLKKKKD